MVLPDLNLMSMLSLEFKNYPKNLKIIIDQACQFSPFSKVIRDKKQ